MGSVSKDATLIAISRGAQIQGPDDPTTGAPTSLDTLNLSIVLGEGTPGEQRQTFMVLDSDYAALGSPPYGAAITVTLTTP